MKWRSPSTPLQDWPTRPAIALVEALIAGAVLAAAALFFLVLWREARTDMSRARQYATASSIAQDVLNEAQQRWPRFPTSGARNGFTWALNCAPSALERSPRFALVNCTIRVEAALDLQTLVLETAWARPWDDLLRR